MVCLPWLHETWSATCICVVGLKEGFKPPNKFANPKGAIRMKGGSEAFGPVLIPPLVNAGIIGVIPKA